MLTLFVLSSLNVRGKAKESGHIENSQSLAESPPRDLQITAYK